MWSEIRQVLDELNIWSVLLRSLLAIMIGGSLGIERGYKNRAAGFRTYILVCLGAALATMSGLHLSSLYGGGDPARVAAQIISGIGFLGAGSILVTRDKRVEGLTTATGLWVVAAIGIALGSGFYFGAVLAGVLVIITFTFMETVEIILLGKRHFEYFYVELGSGESLVDFLAYLAGQGLEPQKTALQKEQRPDSPVIGVNLKLKLNKGQSPEAVLDLIADFPNVTYVAGDID